MLKLVSAFDTLYIDVLDYYNSFSNIDDLNSYVISNVVMGENEYFGYIIKNEEVGQSKLFYLVDDSNPHHIIGFSSIQFGLDFTEEELNFGNIGYGIRPEERRKGYGKVILELTLIECEKMGLSEVCISCHEDNISSKRVIESGNGYLEKRFFDEETGKYALKYIIKLHPKFKNRIKRKILDYKSYITYH